jgi:glutamate-1-semialdehyde 2,1-aminomutase
LGAGIPTGTFGMTQEIADQIKKLVELSIIDLGGIGGTLAGSALSLAAMKATLQDVLTEPNFAKMIELGNHWCDGIDATIAEFGLDWHCNRLGARGEYIFKGKAPRTGKEAANSGDFELEQYIHLRLLNDGFLLTPFHNMALMCPDTTEADVDAHTAAFRAMCAELVAIK